MLHVTPAPGSLAPPPPHDIAAPFVLFVLGGLVLDGEVPAEEAMAAAATMGLRIDTAGAMVAGLLKGGLAEMMGEGMPVLVRGSAWGTLSMRTQTRAVLTHLSVRVRPQAVGHA